MNKWLFRKTLSLAAMVTILLCFPTSYAQKTTKTFLERYDLSTTVINPDTAPHVPGHYIYAHSFHYDLHGNHLEVYETGTMDFQANGTAIDSARQVYVATLKDGGTATYVFNYVSPSRWRLNKKDFYFSGNKETFRMEVIKTSLKGCNSSQTDELALISYTPYRESRVFIIWEAIHFFVVIGYIVGVGIGTAVAASGSPKIGVFTCKHVNSRVDASGHSPKSC